MVLRARFARHERDADYSHEVWPIRVSRVAGMYLVLAIAGGGYLLFPSPAITRGLGPESATIWALFLLIGGALGFLSITRIVFFEYMGLPLIITAFGLFGLCCFWVAYVAWKAGARDSVAWVLGLVFVAIAAGFYARMRDLRSQIKTQRALRQLHEQQQDTGEGDDGAVAAD